MSTKYVMGSQSPWVQTDTTCGQYYRNSSTILLSWTVRVAKKYHFLIREVQYGSVGEYHIIIHLCHYFS